MVTLEAHLATLKAKDSSLTGQDIRVPFPALGEPSLYQRGIKSQRVLVTSVMSRIAVVCDRDTPLELIHSDRTMKTTIALYAITVDPADVQVVDRSAHRAKVIAAARGRRASRNNSFGRAGKGVRQAAEARRSHQEAQKGV